MSLWYKSMRDSWQGQIHFLISEDILNKSASFTFRESGFMSVQLGSNIKETLYFTSSHFTL